MKIAIGADHAGFDAREALIKHFKASGHEVLDCGAVKIDPNDDYPVYAEKVAEAVAQKKVDQGVLLCGNGLGMSIVANKVPGVRAGLVMSEKMAHDTKTHNDCNVLVLAGRDLPIEANLKLADYWLSLTFDDKGRHARRVQEIKDIEKKFLK